MNRYSERRRRLLETVDDDSIVILFSGKAPYRSADETYDFSIDRNFYYLTGLDAEDMVLVLTKLSGKLNESIFILPFDENMARWVGGRLLPEKVREISGIESVSERNDLDDSLASLFNRNRLNDRFSVYFDFWHYAPDQADTPALAYAHKLEKEYPYLIMKDIYPHLTKMRLIKDDYEISCIRKAIRTTNLGIRQMMKASRPGVNEMVMEGIFEFVLKQLSCKELAFQTIAASGKRATILHYADNDQVMHNGELFLCDLGATCEHYCADISRTFPVNGRFNERQKELYQIVLNAQKMVAWKAAPGMSLRDLNKIVTDYYEEELPKHGLKKGVSEYYFHSVSHHLGLDTHDVDGGLPLEAGNVITDEPGLYVADEGIGIRIEDDLLITETGAEVLSQEIDKEIEDIEDFMSGQ
ncbi:MAG: aminopeptidase P N-terminal domain-containing protein [Erysipelotrichaceae bacterium]|nr:aminopeptidase P N-terminal domain-containing protein [Erysipelotrichaceae bacterium]